jgi:hypothetical protein
VPQAQLTSLSDDDEDDEADDDANEPAAVMRHAQLSRLSDESDGDAEDEHEVKMMQSDNTGEGHSLRYYRNYNGHLAAGAI